jgi:hypothetical protein
MERKFSFTYIIIAILFSIIMLQRACSFKKMDPTVEIKTDTIYKTIKDTVIKKVKVKDIVYVYPDGEEYKPGDNIDTCTIRFNKLLKEFSAKRTYVDTIKIDTIGSITVYDTVWKNELSGNRKYVVDYKIPYVTKTITKQEESKRQLYVGLNGFANRNDITVFSPGFIYKTKKDHIYQASLGVSFDGTITYGFGTYWKIKIK